MPKRVTNLHVPDANSLQISSGNKSVSYEAQTANHTYVLLENVKQYTCAHIKTERLCLLLNLKFRYLEEAK